MAEVLHFSDLDYPATVEIYNYTGALLKTAFISASKPQISMAELSSGCYNIVIIDGDSSIRFKKVIKN